MLDAVHPIFFLKRVEGIDRPGIVVVQPDIADSEVRIATISTLISPTACFLPVTNDANGRVSTARGYLTTAVRRRGNLTIMTQTTVRPIIFEGRTATASPSDSDNSHYGAYFAEGPLPGESYLRSSGSSAWAS